MTDDFAGSGDAGPGRKDTVGVEDYPWWSSSRYVRHTLFERRMHGIEIGLWVFGVYWLLPLVLSLVAGTTLPRGMVSDWSSDLATNLPDLLPLASLIDVLARHQQLAEPDAITYLTDRTHFVFAVLIAIGGGLAGHVVRQFHATVIRLRNGGLPDAADAELKPVYDHYRGLATHRGFRALSLVLALFTFAIFYYLSVAASHVHWWGHSNYGYAGVAFALAAALMVYWGSRAVMLMGMGSVMLARIIRFPLKLRPFHPDGCNGLAPLGRQIINLWLFALVLAFAIYVTLSFGYLGVEKTVTVWVLALMGTLMIPALAVFPLLAALKSIHEARRGRLAHFESVLHNLLDEVEQASVERNYGQAIESVTRMKDIEAAHTIINTANVWPFNPRALMSILVVNAVQIVLTLDQLFKVFD